MMIEALFSFTLSQIFFTTAPDSPIGPLFSSTYESRSRSQDTFSFASGVPVFSAWTKGLIPRDRWKKSTRLAAPLCHWSKNPWVYGCHGLLFAIAVFCWSNWLWVCIWRWVWCGFVLHCNGAGGFDFGIIYGEGFGGFVWVWWWLWVVGCWWHLKWSWVVGCR